MRQHGSGSPGGEIGSELDRHIERSELMARRVDRRAPAWAHRVATDGRTVTDIAAEVIALTGWMDKQTWQLTDGGRSGHGAVSRIRLAGSIAAIATNSPTRSGACSVSVP
jgi:hypothetical protein